MQFLVLHMAIARLQNYQKSDYSNSHNDYNPYHFQFCPSFLFQVLIVLKLALVFHILNAFDKDVPPLNTTVYFALESRRKIIVT